MPPTNQENTRSRQVMLHTYDNEPTARMAEQRLRSVGVPAMVRSLQGAPDCGAQLTICPTVCMSLRQTKPEPGKFWDWSLQILRAMMKLHPSGDPCG